MKPEMRKKKLILRAIERSLANTPMGRGIPGKCAAARPAQIRAAAKQIYQQGRSLARKGGAR